MRRNYHAASLDLMARARDKPQAPIDKPHRPHDHLLYPGHTLTTTTRGAVATDTLLEDCNSRLQQYGGLHAMLFRGGCANGALVQRVRHPRCWHQNEVRRCIKGEMAVFFPWPCACVGLASAVRILVVVVVVLRLFSAANELWESFSTCIIF